METLKRVQFGNLLCVMCVEREKIAPAAIQFHRLRRFHRGLYESCTYENSQRR